MNIPKYMDETIVLKMTDNKNVFKDGLLWGANHVGLHATFLTDSRGHELFITSTEDANMQKLSNDKSFIDRIRKQSESKGVNEIRMDYFVFDISSVGSENVFSYNMQIMRQVHLMSIARNCFHEFGYELPISMFRYTIESLWELDQMRTSPRVSEAVRQSWNEIYEKAVKNAYLYYQPQDEKLIGKLVNLFRSKSQQVSKDWFIENHVQTCWELVTEDAWNYMKSIIKEQYPEFRYYLDNAMVRAIQNRLEEEMNTYEPSSKKAIEAARANQELLRSQEGMDI